MTDSYKALVEPEEQSDWPAEVYRALLAEAASTISRLIGELAEEAEKARTAGEFYQAEVKRFDEIHDALEDRAEAAEAEAVRLRGVVEMISRMKRDIDPGINITTLSAAIQLSQAALTPPSAGE